MKFLFFRLYPYMLYTKSVTIGAAIHEKKQKMFKSLSGPRGESIVHEDACI